MAFMTISNCSHSKVIQAWTECLLHLGPLASWWWLNEHQCPLVSCYLRSRVERNLVHYYFWVPYRRASYFPLDFTRKNINYRWHCYCSNSIPCCITVHLMIYVKCMHECYLPLSVFLTIVLVFSLPRWFVCHSHSPLIVLLSSKLRH